LIDDAPALICTGTPRRIAGPSFSYAGRVFTTPTNPPFIPMQMQMQMPNPNPAPAHALFAGDPHRHD
jgi:hypothetical protein